jgi:hypothetical protein
MAGTRGWPAVAFGAFVSIGAVTLVAQQSAQPRNDLPQPYKTSRDWGELPAGMTWPAVTAV